MGKDNLRIKLRNLKTRSSVFEIGSRTVILLIVIALFLISLTLYITSSFNKANRIFFFTDHQSGKVIGETRRIPGTPSISLFRQQLVEKREKNMDIFVNELLLGPVNMKLDPVFSSGTKLEKILYRNKIVYLDLNFMTLLPDKKAVQGFEESLLLLEKNIKFNFPYIRRVVITILGQEPEFELTYIFLE